MQHTLLSVDDFVTRRAHFIDQMPNNSITLISAASEVTRSNDTDYGFCQNKNFYYLTGFNEPDAILLLIKAQEANSQRQCVLFCREKNPLEEVWHGRRVGPQKAMADYGFEQCFVLNEVNTLIPQYLNNKSQLLFCHGDMPAFDKQIFSWLDTVKAGNRQGKQAPSTLVDCTSLLDQMRLIKSSNELNVMRQVNIISGNAHQRAMKKSAVGTFEYQIEAEILHEFAINGARYPAYGTIVAGGDNANILHYTDNNQVLNDGELLLIDAGGELAGYAADITRTFPVNGQFTPAQKIIYQLVLDAQELAINAVKPHANFAQLNALTCNFLTTELHKLNILKGNLPQLIKDKACKKYFIHGLGHWLGLDVHDVGDYQVNDNRQQLRSFEPGMVMTIEPGLYIPLGDTDVDEKWRGIGVRIEDNVLVTDQGHENLTTNAPKSIVDIENLMAEH
jgi:Xaa-Pro aminopeptidase